MLASREKELATKQGIFSHDISAWIQWLFIHRSSPFPLRTCQATTRSLPTSRQRMWGLRRGPHDCIYFHKLLSGHSCYMLRLVSLVNVIIVLRDGAHLHMLKKEFFFFSECQVMNVTHKSLLEELAVIPAGRCSIPRIQACFLQTSIWIMFYWGTSLLVNSSFVCVLFCFVYQTDNNLLSKTPCPV